MCNPLYYSVFYTVNKTAINIFNLYLTRINYKYVKRYLRKLKDFMIRNKPVYDTGGTISYT